MQDFDPALPHCRTLIDSRLIGWRQHARNRIAPIINETIMEVRPEGRVFKIRIHAWKRTCQGAHPYLNLQMAQLRWADHAPQRRLIKSRIAGTNSVGTIITVWPSAT